ncbi:acyltransferase family protein [Actinoalloteichus hymeniacidonis]|uniref:Acyltransferase family protein n=2 Tax=Actinoalloteichus hymeniacidonis TaxID=340345 RepID=A0AAC9MWV6_9PSEU|nr:acyltransferase family protein [Actinoalloteichus hymeniacidonis]
MTSPTTSTSMAMPQVPSNQPPAQELTAAELDRAGLLHADPGARISRFAVFVPTDALGTLRPVTIHSGAVVSPFSVVHGGTTIGAHARIEGHTIVGTPELGYAVGRVYPGVGGGTMIGAGAVVRSGAVVYADVQIGLNVLIGHHTLLRTDVQVGAESQLGHHLTVERASRIGREVRCSPGSHITSSTVLADRVFLGAGVRTINDKTLTWRDPLRKPLLIAPQFDTGAKIGSGSIVLAGIRVGEQALIGSGSLLTRDIPPGALAYGHPARVHGEV